MLATEANRFTGIITNFTGRPNAVLGTVVTPGNNTYPAYLEILPDIAFECFAIDILVTGASASATAKDAILTIGFDYAGGTTYTDCEINHLIVSQCSPSLLVAQYGVRYHFPLYIPSGTAVAAKGSVGNATVGTLNVYVKLYGRPTNPELLRAGRYVTTFGATPATSTGTTITSGGASEGAWTEMTTATTTRPHWWWQAGFGCNDSTMSDALYGLDLSVGDATDKTIVFEDDWVTTASTERVGRPGLSNFAAGVFDAPTGVRVYTRLQCNTTADASLSTVAYGLGG